MSLQQCTIAYQEIIQAIDSLPAQERNSLLELISQQQDERGGSRISATTRQAAGIGIAKQEQAQDEDVIRSIAMAISVIIKSRI